MSPTAADIFGTAVFAVAVAHTFLVKRFEHLAKRFRHGSVGENAMHLLAEVEIVFGLWSAVLIGGLAAFHGWGSARTYLESRNFAEPVFVVAIMVMAASTPITSLAGKVLAFVARLLPLPRAMATFIVVLTFGPLLGSLITEPAAMTLTALLMKRDFFDANVSTRFRYAAIGALFVNVSIGGTLTHFAAPPILIVAERFGWDTWFVLSHIGWKGALAGLVTSVGIALLYRRELSLLTIGSEQDAPRVAAKAADADAAKGGPSSADHGEGADVEADHATSREEPSRVMPSPLWVALVHIGFIAFIVWNSHHPILVAGALLFFLGWARASSEYQEPLRVREGLLVGFFLGGLVVLGGRQEWWLSETISRLTPLPMFSGATALTAITDNAALTYLGSLAPLDPAQKLALVTGAVTGGGLTVIANAPNPAGFQILRGSFGDEGISPLGLFLGALGPTAVAAVIMYLIPW